LTSPPEETEAPYWSDTFSPVPIQLGEAAKDSMANAKNTKIVQRRILASDGPVGLNLSRNEFMVTSLRGYEKMNHGWENLDIWLAIFS